MSLFDKIFEILKKSLVDYCGPAAPMTGETVFLRDDW
jgi:hypothetical protein